MSNPKSLTINSLIKIIGEEKLYATVEGFLYQYVIIIDRETPPKVFNFRTEYNPIKWLIFNNSEFLQMVMNSALGHDKTKQFVKAILTYVQNSNIGKDWIGYDEDPNYNYLVDFDFIDDAVKLLHKSDENLTELINAAWRDIRKITCKNFDEMLTAADYNNHYIYQFKEGTQKDFLTINADIVIKDLGR